MAGNTIYEDPQTQPGDGGENITPITIEGILDKIAETIVTSVDTGINPNLVNKNQKTIRNGIISIGRENSEKLLLFQKDVKANAEDLQTTQGGETLSSIVNIISEFGGGLETTQVNITPLENGAFSIHLYSGDLDFDITNILSEISTSDDGTKTILNPLNVSQFINIEQQSTSINVQKANEFLDTNIYELLPSTSIRQDQINKLFIDINDLLPPKPPTDNEYGLDDNDGRINRNQDGQWEGSEQYYLDNSITAPQDNPNSETIDEEDAYITRLNENAVDNSNSSKTIESLRNRLNNYLKDVDEQPVPPEDERPEYINQSDGYLKFRNLNQGIIIRNTNSNFIEGLNPSNLDYLMSGFTITMWVRFLDKTSQGTLFNFGNPTRENNPFGFKLETYTINGNDLPLRNGEYGQTEGEYLSGYGSDGHTWKQIFKNGGHTSNDGDLLDYPNGNAPQQGFFEDTDTERFVRLVVKDGDGRLRGSHIGMPFLEARRGLPDFGYQDFHTDGFDGAEPGVVPYDHAYGLMTNTRIPTNFNEWYFICATFNPAIGEDDSHDLVKTEDYSQLQYNSDFWRNNVELDGTTSTNSNYGKRCKVEIISRTDLLRARGFKV